jgi:prephenate dehydrogenase
MTGQQQQQWNRATVVGCGLIGASFALALKRAGLCAVVAGWDKSSSVLDEARARGAIDETDQAFALGEVSSSDLIYLAMPVEEIIGFLNERGASVKPGALVTDAGSTKREICRAARSALPKDCRFIGGHPVAGSHLRGLRHASAELFKDAPYVLIAGEAESEHETKLYALKETLSLLGARVAFMTADEHDRAMALVSHLPQLVSSALQSVVGDQPDAGALLNLSGAGYRDMTRLAASSWSVWRGILATNPSHIVAALDTLVEKLSAVGDELRGAREGSQLKTTSSLFMKSSTAKEHGE